MSKKIERREFLKGGFIIVSGGIIAVLSEILGCRPIENIIESTESEKTVASTASLLTHTLEVQSVEETSIETDTLATQGQESTSTESTQTLSSSNQSTTSTAVPGEVGKKFPGRVIQIRHNAVHTWDYRSQNYWDYVDQSVMDTMVDEGVMKLTGGISAVDAWRILIPNYQAGQIVAIKVSFNNSYDDVGSIGMIDGIIEPVNSIIRGLNMIGVPNSSVVVYDSSRWLPLRFTEGCDYPGVVFRYSAHDPWGQGAVPVTFNPPGISEFTQNLSREIAQASYLINVPILKAHGMTKISMGMKNHYGSIQIPEALHQWSTVASPDFSEAYNPIVDINNHPEIRDKTILTVGDSIFAAFHNYDRSFPQPWRTFNNETPKSLFFATDPVAIDCVMSDLLSEEKISLGTGEIKPVGFAYLSLAETVGLGIYERGNPWKNNYSKIDFVKHELSI